MPEAHMSASRYPQISYKEKQLRNTGTEKNETNLPIFSIVATPHSIFYFMVLKKNKMNQRKNNNLQMSPIHLKLLHRYNHSELYNTQVEPINIKFMMKMYVCTAHCTPPPARPYQYGQLTVLRPPATRPRAAAHKPKVWAQISQQNAGSRDAIKSHPNRHVGAGSRATARQSVSKTVHSYYPQSHGPICKLLNVYPPYKDMKLNNQ